MLRLKEVEIEGFRAFSKRQKIDLDYDVIAFIGDMGTGKSSILSAIEFALYGTTYEVKERKAIRVEDLVNDFSKSIYIRLVMIDEEGNEYEIVRERKRRGRGRAQLRVNGNLIASGFEEVTQKVIELLGGLTFDDFSRHVLVRREVLDAIIIGQPMERSEAIDRLLGIATLEYAYRNMPLKEVRSVMEDLSLRRDRIRAVLSAYGAREKLLSEIEMLENTIKRLNEKLSRVAEEYKVSKREYERLRSLSEKYENILKKLEEINVLISHAEARIREREELTEISETAVLAHAESLKDELVSKLVQYLAGESAEELKKIEISMDNLELVVSKIKSSLEELERMASELQYEVLELTDQVMELKSRYERVRGRYSDIASELEVLSRLREEYSRIVEREGDIPDLTIKKDSIKKDIESLRARIEYEEALVKVLSQVSKELEVAREIPCPVCEVPIRKEKKEIIKTRLANLQTKVKETLAKIKELERRLEEMERTLARLRELKEQMLDIEVKEREAERLREEYEDVERRYREILEVIEDARGRLHSLLNFIDRARERVRWLEKATSVVIERRRLREYFEKARELKEQLTRLGFDPEHFKRLGDRLLELEKERRMLEEEVKRCEQRRQELLRSIEELDKLEGELNDLEEKLRRLEALKTRLEKIKSTYRVVQRLMRERMLERLVPALNEVFRRVYVHPDYDSLNLKVEIRTVSGQERSMYNLLARRCIDGQWVPVLNRLSDGQRMIVALSLVIALSIMEPHNAAFLLLDEPTPNIDLSCRKALINALSGIMRGDKARQLIIASQNPEYGEIVKQSVEKGNLRGCVYRLSWGGREGPRLEIAFRSG